MATYRTDIGFHDTVADELFVGASSHSVNGTNWARLQFARVDVSFFAGTPDETTAILLKVRNAIDDALANQVVPTALREAA